MTELADPRRERQRHQRATTRTRLRAAARAMMARGEELSVAGCAKEAGVSRATAYRYYSDADALGVDAMEEPSPTAPHAADPRQQAHEIRRAALAQSRSDETQMRQYLARSLDSWVTRAGAPQGPPRALATQRAFRDALAPMRRQLGAAKVERAALMLSMVSGIEGWLALRDVCGLTDSAAEALSTAIADAILNDLERGGG